MLIGVAGRFGAPLEKLDNEAIEEAQVEAIKVTHWEQPIGVFTVLQPPADETAVPMAERAYRHGVRYITIHEHPNACTSGWSQGYKNGLEFSRGWIAAYKEAKKLFPNARLGFPACRPGEEMRAFQADAERFFRGCTDAVNAADYYELECLWRTPSEMKVQLWRIDSYRMKLPGKELFVTFANTHPNVPKAEKAEEYLDFYDALSQRGEVKAAFAFCISSPDHKHRPLTWRSESGKTRDIIPTIVGQRSPKEERDESVT
jgi:hypothetical protein